MSQNLLRGSVSVSPGWAARAASQPRVEFVPPSAIIVEIVESGTVVRAEDGSRFTVTEGVAIRRGSTLIATRSVWDALLSCTEVRDIG